MAGNVFFSTRLTILSGSGALSDVSLLIVLSICCNVIVLLKGIGSGYLVVGFISLISACDVGGKKVALKAAAFSSFDAVILLSVGIKCCVDVIFM